MKTVLATLNAKYIHSSLALRYLKAFCNDICDFKVKEFSINNSLFDILSEIYAEKPDVVGLACYIWNIDMTLELANLLKKVLPDTVIILGGPEVSYDPEDIMEQHKYIDYIVQGEGEETLYKLLTQLKAKAEVSAIPNLAQRINNKIALNGDAGIVKNLNSIPFPYNDEEISTLKDKIIYYESSRGCPFSCQYCLSSATQGVRFLEVDRVIKDLSFFIRHDVRQVKFVDRTFNARKDHYLPILQFISQQNCRTNFHFEIAADILDEEVLEILKTIPNGRVQFEIGIQSTNSATLAQIRRSNNWPKIVDNVTNIIATGNIHVHLDLIVGLPEEDYKTFGKSFNDVYNLKPHMLQIGFLKLLKGSGIRKCAKEHSYIFMDSAPYQVLGNKYLSFSEVRKLHLMEEIFNQVYNSGRFSHTLDYFIGYHNGDAFGFYNSLTDFWEQRELHIVAHSPKSLYQYLREFCQLLYEDTESLCDEFLKFDALITEKGSLRPDVLGWNENCWNDETTAFWRNEKLVHKYISDYKFTTWRDIKKKHHIEVFTFDVPCYIKNKNILKKSTPVLFSFNGEEVDFKTIEAGDFWIGGQ
ncbi:B12-binding domain-containing radical SAM protein [Dendrosporobacter sp. 1207_IL3150]|uniref:B12-binding domain-containing radical SAM protein n=1 Tax=Dendrosporobacter sp. 1207_IL3150 TaxID=3084054 RepID=UPI002FDB95A6